MGLKFMNKLKVYDYTLFIRTSNFWAEAECS